LALISRRQIRKGYLLPTFLEKCGESQNEEIDKLIADVGQRRAEWGVANAMVEEYEDAVEFATAPLAPGQSAQFQMAFEHISAQWNLSAPEIRVLRVATK